MRPLPKSSTVLVLLGFVLLGAAPPLAGQMTTLVVCNKGTVPAEVVVAKRKSFLGVLWIVTGTPVAPGACEQVYYVWMSGCPAYIGFGFADSRGQWGSGTVDPVPDIGNFRPLNIFQSFMNHPYLSRKEVAVCARKDRTFWSFRGDPLPDDCDGPRETGGNDIGTGPYVRVTAPLYFDPQYFGGCYTSDFPGMGGCNTSDYYFKIAPDGTNHEVHAAALTGPEIAALNGVKPASDAPVIEFPPVRPRTPAVMPKDPNDYMGIRTYLVEKVGEEGPEAVYRLSDNRVKLTVIDHCLATKDLTYLGTLLTAAEVAKLRSQQGQTEVKADVNRCIGEYDAKEIAGNHNAALEYCFQQNNPEINRRTGKPPIGFDACMNRHDMLQAMCKQQLELRVAYSMRNSAGQARPPQTCRVTAPSPKEVGMILGAPPRAAMAELPAKFTAGPPDVVVAGAALPNGIAAGTILHTSLHLPINAISIDRNMVANTRLDEAISVGGQPLFLAGTYIFLKARVIGPGPRPGSIQVGLSTDWAMAQPDNHKVQISSDELVFTIARQGAVGAGVNLVIPAGTKLDFTIKQ